MATTAPSYLTARKQPRQARATVTLDAIFEAAIQVLMVDGPRLTTTRVAQRAGVSVGTMYQYFPHKQALIYALNERYLDALAVKVEDTCQSHRGATLGEMVDALVTTYWKGKTERPDVTCALYRAIGELDTEALVTGFARRVDAATTEMLASAPDGDFANLSVVNLTLVTAIFGAVRNIFERNLTADEGTAVYQQLILMCRSYLHAARLRVSTGPTVTSQDGQFAIKAMTK